MLHRLNEVPRECLHTAVVEAARNLREKAEEAGGGTVTGEARLRGPRERERMARMSNLTSSRENSAEAMVVLNALMALAELGMAGIYLSSRDSEGVCIWALAAALAGSVTVLQYLATARAHLHPAISVFWGRWQPVLQSLPFVGFASAFAVPDLVRHRGAFQTRDWLLAVMLSLSMISSVTKLSSSLRRQPT
jgi:hypothetical protein